MSLKILFIGATGYVGGSILSRIIKHPKRGTFDTTLLLRSASKAAGFEPYGFKTVIGSLSDLELLERLSSESDVVFQTADADDLPATNAILSGLKKRFEETKTPPVLIHTSGTGVLIDEGDGTYKSEEIYSDLDLAKIDALPDTQLHRPIELAILKAAKEGYVKTYIVLPSTIFGIASTKFTEKDLQKPLSQQIPTLVAMSLSRGQTPIIGDGVNVWPFVEIGEVADFYYRLFDAVISGKNPDNGHEGYYFLENGEYTQKQAVDTIAATLYKLGKVRTDKPVRLTDEEMNSIPNAKFFGTNSRARAERASALGWKPVKGMEDFLKSIEVETEYIVKTMK